jgi:hypothetical protein
VCYICCRTKAVTTLVDSVNMYICIGLYVGVRRGAVGSGTALQAGRSRVRFPMESLEFFSDLILPVAL